MMTQNIEQLFWHIVQRCILTLSEIGFVAFLVRKITDSHTTSLTFFGSHARLCQELDISRNQLRRLRSRLVETGVLSLLTTEGKGGGTAYRLIPADTTPENMLYPVDTVCTEVSLESTVAQVTLSSERTVTQIMLFTIGMAKSPQWLEADRINRGRSEYVELT